MQIAFFTENMNGREGNFFFDAFFNAGFFLFYEVINFTDEFFFEIFIRYDVVFFQKQQKFFIKFCFIGVVFNITQQAV
jgi:hypothetical protein